MTKDDRDRTIEEHAYLCSRAAQKFLRPGLDRADLRQIAAIGLIKAYDRYDAALDTPFEAFAWLFIVGELMHFVRDHERIVRPPRRLRSLERRVQDAADTLAFELGREPTYAEIAQRLGVRLSEVEEIGRYREQAISQPLDDLKPHQLRPYSYTIGEPETRLLLQAALEQLTTVERTIIVALYTRGYTQHEVAHRLGYSRRHVSRLHRTALKKLLPMCVSA
jgi:RNA polymerase sigma-B factor